MVLSPCKRSSCLLYFSLLCSFLLAVYEGLISMLTTSKTIFSWIAIALVAASYLPAANQGPSSPAAPSAAQSRAVLNRYCVTCHNEKLRTAGLTLEKIDIEKVSEDAEVWEKVIRKLRAGQMPPAGLPRPDSATYDSFATYLETEIDRVAAANPNPGRPSSP